MSPKKGWRDGSIRRLPSGAFQVRWRENGERRGKTFKTIALAETFRRATLGDLARGEAGLPPDPKRFPALDALAQEWIARREHTHRSWKDDRGRWNLHLKPVFGKLRAAEVDVAKIRAFCERESRQGTNEDTLRLLVACASSLFTDLCERPRETGVSSNPFRGLPKSLRRLFKSKHDSRFTPYVEKLDDVIGIFDALPEPQRIAYAIGVVAGLRPGEILALEWTDVRDGERIDVRRQVQDGRPGPLKDDEARILTGPFLAPLWPVLKAWRLRTGGRGLLFPPSLTRAPGRRSGAFMHPRRLTEAITAQTVVSVSEWSKPWYQATRHTMASHWVRAGHPIAELALVLGHSTTYVTEHYAHIRPAQDRQADPWLLKLGHGRGTPLDSQRAAK